MSGLKGKTRVFLIDDHRIVLDGLEALLGRESDMAVCGVAEDGETALQDIARAKPDIVIVDISLQKGKNGIEMTKELHEKFPQLKILVLSQNSEEIYAERAIRAGAHGYITKSEATKTLVGAIRTVMAGKIHLSDNMMSKMLIDVLHNNSAKSNPVDQLSDREFEVFVLMGKGYKSADIAKKMQISIKTVDSHRFHIKEKFNLESVSDIVKYAIEWSRTH